MQIEIWADVVCPWCYLGKRRFERALGQFAHRGEVEVRWRSYQLDPSAPAFDAERPYEDHAGYLSRRFGGGREAGLKMIEHVSRLAAQEGLAYRLAEVKSGNTRDAHRLLHAAWQEGGPALQGALAERLFRGYFVESEPIDDPRRLAHLAADAGLSVAVAERVLAGQEFAAEVAEDVDLAQSLGASGVPFFVIDARYGVAGAQPVEALSRVLERAWSEHVPA